MSLETGSFIGDLNSANPPGTDPKSQGDDHIRLIKTALKNCFPGMAGAIMVDGVDGGLVNAYTVTPTTPLLAYTPGMLVIFSPSLTNSGTSTINVSGLGVTPLRQVHGAETVAGDLVAGYQYVAQRNGASEFRLIGPTKNYIDQLAFGSALPAQAVGFVASNGTSAAFTQTHSGYAQKETKGANIASAATINLTTATGNLVHITGSTGPVTAFSIDSGAEYTIVWDGTPTVVNSANLILPTSANISVKAGDVWRVRGDGAAARVVSIQPISGDSAKGSGRVLLNVSQTTASATFNMLNVFSSAYDVYEIEVLSVQPSVSDQLSIQFAVAGTVDTTNNYYTLQNSTSSTANSFAALTSTSVFAGTLGCNATALLINVNSVTGIKSIQGHSTAQSGATAFAGTAVQSAYKGSNAVSGFCLLWSSGALFAAGSTIRIFGLKNTV